ncbi:hypothetical protein [Bradyrhizobium sp. JYMT SZCCT0180]|uniref:T4 family baseplate hub assembly chaperone n=1 Tax=Bradyrhizobium sp. JYMT SZCCT0180 TaxID=2807666 RepID=UPI001BA8FD4C|nr:hypothetical protein [Bradyrhizobium sp. JYMT SZCCT0180]MBR1214641.1 hypothetical protein [Bradyrhizobium sp. JYMT SZCCT0180]
MVAPVALLEVWEQALPLKPSARPIALLSLAFSKADAEELARLPLGIRDARLLRLRQALFGDSLDCLTACPACGAELEFTVSAGDLLQQAGEPAANDHWLQAPHHQVHFRVPDSTDLMALPGLASKPDEYWAKIVGRCVIDVQGRDGSVELENLPQDLVELLAREMERRDPLAMVWLDLVCAQCGHAWPSLFDIASLLWADVDRWARRLLHEVNLLARAYGWTERDVLQLSAARRQHYLGMIGA